MPHVRPDFKAFFPFIGELSRYSHDDSEISLNALIVILKNQALPQGRRYQGPPMSPYKELTLRLDRFHYEVGEISNFVRILEGNYVTGKKTL